MVHCTKAKRTDFTPLSTEGQRLAPQDILVGRLSGMIVIGVGLWILSFFWCVSPGAFGVGRPGVYVVVWGEVFIQS